MSFFYKVTRNSKNKEYKVILSVTLSDPCLNGINRFAFTAEIYKRSPTTNRLIEIQSGSIPKRDPIIEEVFPEIEKFLCLHGADEQGRPIYYIINPVYYLKNNQMKIASEYLNIDEETASRIWDRIKSFDQSDKDFNQKVEEIYKEFGLFDKWQKLADECIEYFTKQVTEE